MTILYVLYLAADFFPPVTPPYHGLLFCVSNPMCPSCYFKRYQLIDLGLSLNVYSLSFTNNTRRDSTSPKCSLQVWIREHSVSYISPVGIPIEQLIPFYHTNHIEWIKLWCYTVAWKPSLLLFLNFQAFPQNFLIGFLKANITTLTWYHQCLSAC